MHTEREVLGKTSTNVTRIYILHIHAGIIIHTRNTHGEGKSRSHLLAVLTAGASCWTTHRSTDGRTNGQTHIYRLLSRLRQKQSLSASLALDSYRKIPMQSPSLRHIFFFFSSTLFYYSISETLHSFLISEYKKLAHCCALLCLET